MVYILELLLKLLLILYVGKIISICYESIILIIYIYYITLIILLVKNKIISLDISILNICFDYPNSLISNSPIDQFPNCKL